MIDLLNILLPLAGEETFQPAIQSLLEKGDLLNLALLLEKHGRINDVQTICTHILQNDPSNTTALQLSIRTLTSQGKSEEALERLIHLKHRHEIFLRETLHTFFNDVATLQTNSIAAGEITKAIKITKMVGELLPETDFSKQLEALSSLEFGILQQKIPMAKNNGQLEEELDYRVRLFRHPLRDQLSTAVQLDNIYYALSLLLYEDMNAEKQHLAREMIAYSQSLPPSQDTTPYLHIFERFYQLLIGCIDLDVVFGPPLQVDPWPDIPFYTSQGEPLTVSGINELIQQQGVDVIFLTSASQLFSLRYTNSFAAAIQQSCDCNYLVIVSVSTGKDAFFNVIKQVNIQDARVIFCWDHFDPQPGEYLSYSANNTEPLTLLGHYYASVGLLCLGTILHHFNRPAFVLGIDTILHLGVKDLLDDFRDKDVVFNLMAERSSMASQLINSLLLFYPTANAMILAAFFKSYFGQLLQRREQPAFIDQLILVLAKHHILHCGQNVQLGYFRETDINNLMFNTDNIGGAIHLLKRYRFLNIFSSGNEEKGLSPENVLQLLKET